MAADLAATEAVQGQNLFAWRNGASLWMHTRGGWWNLVTKSVGSLGALVAGSFWSGCVYVLNGEVDMHEVFKPVSKTYNTDVGKHFGQFGSYQTSRNRNSISEPCPLAEVGPLDVRSQSVLLARLPAPSLYCTC